MSPSTIPGQRRPAASEPQDERDIATKIETIGPSYRVTVDSLGATFVFRDVRVDKDLAADVAVSHGGRHLFRSTSALSITGRKNIARTAAEMDSGDYRAWLGATFAAAEAVMEAVEQLASGVDLRYSPLVTDRPAWTARPFWPDGAGFLIMPGDAGKSTIIRAVAVSICSGREIIPGIVPLVRGPVLLVVAEDPSQRSHTFSIEAICRGAGIDRSSLEYPIILVPSKGRPLHRLVRSLAERAADAAGVILDAQQGLLAIGEQGNIRDQAALFWNAIDELDRPAFVIAHPNLEQARNWNRSDGRGAGSEVNRDRPRISWAGHWADEKAVAGSSFRRYTLTCTKYNNGPHPSPLSFGMSWRYSLGDDDPGEVSFSPCQPVVRVRKTDAGALSPAMQETLDAYRAGATTAAKLQEALGLATYETAHTRLIRLQKSGALDEVTE